MTFSGSWSPTFTESNSRSAIVEATSFSIGTTGKGRVGLLNGLAPVVGDDVLGHDDVRTERLSNRVHPYVAVERVALPDRLQELQLLVDLDDLFVGDRDVIGLEHGQLCLIAEHRDERQRREKRVVAERRRRVLVLKLRLVVLDRHGVLANLLPADHVV